MQARTVALLVAGAVVLGIGGWQLADRGMPQVQEEIAEGSLAFPGLAARLGDARRITVTRQDTTLTLARRPDGGWGIADRGNYPAQANKVRELLTGLTELRLSERRTADPELLDRLGLEEPTRAGSTAHLLRILDGDGKPIVELIIGRRRVRVQANVPESVYVRRPGENQTWLAEGRLPVDNDRQLWFDRDVANIGRDRIARAEVTRGEERLVFATGADGRFTLTEPAEHPALDEYRVEDVSRGFEMLSFTDVLPDADGPTEEVGSALYTLASGTRITVRVAKKGEEVWARLSAAGDGDAKAEADALQARFAGWAFQLGSWKEKAFVPRLEDLKAEERTPPASTATGATPAPSAPAATPAPAQ